MNPGTHVSWRQVYIVVAISFVLLFGQDELPVSQGWHKLIEIALILTMFGLIARWLWRNNAALEEESLRYEIEQQAAERHVTLTPVQTNYLLTQARGARNHAHGNN